MAAKVEIRESDGCWTGSFDAMASPCEVIVDAADGAMAKNAIEAAADEARRIERKFSRYRKDNTMYRVNVSDGKTVTVDDEFADLLDFAAECYAMSDGAFDVTSGVLRRAWRFDGSDAVPSRADVAALMSLVGWGRVIWERPCVTLQPGMEIDFGGFGKEYAVDRAAQRAREAGASSFLVNMGGDVHVGAPRADGAPWRIGIEHPDHANTPVHVVDVRAGGLATSGDARRFLLKDGVRYTHILDPRSGWPVTDAPRAVTVIAANCTEAGLLATLALLQGRDAEAFLRNERVAFWCYR